MLFARGKGWTHLGSRHPSQLNFGSQVWQLDGWKGRGPMSDGVDHWGCLRLNIAVCLVCVSQSALKVNLEIVMLQGVAVCF